MKLSRLLKDVPHEFISGRDVEISSVTHDSRQIKEGSLFICLRGLSVDGHDFIDRAEKSGASAVLVEEIAERPTRACSHYASGTSFWPDFRHSSFVVPSALSKCASSQPPRLAKIRRKNLPASVVGTGPGASIVRVGNTRRAMAYIAANLYGRPAEKLRLVGITGTNGKTSTACFTEEILRKCGHRTGLISTVGAKIGATPMDFTFSTSTTPDPLELHAIFSRMVEAGVETAVMEVSSHALVFDKMEGLLFDIGIFTNLTQDHLDLHGTMENYRLAKARLFTQSKYAVVNIDDESTPVMLEHHSGLHMTYGIKQEADLRAVHIERRPEGMEFELANLGRFRLPAMGKFNVYNALAAIGAARALGAVPRVLRQAVAGLQGVPGRIQSVPNGRGVNVLVDYAHSPDGLVNIISAVREFTGGRVLTLFGCGGDRDKAKRPLMGRVAGEMSDFCILTSDNPRTEDPVVILAQVEEGVKKTGAPYIICENRREAIFAGVRKLEPGDSLIIAGKGHEDVQIIGTTKYRFCDYETALEALQ